MKPYYQDEWVTIYHGDCRDILPELPKVDLVLTDPPYLNLKGGYQRVGDSVAKRSAPSEAVGDLWGANLEWVPFLPPHLGACVFTGHAGVVPVAQAFEGYRQVALLTWWDRTAAPTGKNVPRFRSEFAWCFADEPGIQWDGLTDTVFQVPFPTGFCAPKERTGHPTQKPLALIYQILEALTPTSVLDPFLGSGTTAEAAKRLHQQCIGIEREEEYCEIAAKRMAQEVFDFG